MPGKKRLSWTLLFHLQSDWLIKGGLMNHRADASPLVDGLSRPYIPASTIKGVLRHQCRRLKPLFSFERDYETYLFGDKQHIQGCLYIDDATVQGDMAGDLFSPKRTRIALDRKRRVVLDQAVLVEEVAAQGMYLQSELTCFAKEQEAKEIIPFLTICILNLKAIGSGKSIGRGQIRFKYENQPAPDDATSIVSVKIDHSKLDYATLQEMINQLPVRHKEGESR